MTDTIDLDVFSFLPTPYGGFRLYANRTENQPFRVVSLGQWGDADSPLLRVQSSCMASEVFFATDCDCAEQLRLAFKMVAERGAGIVIHLAQEGRGQGMETKIRACQMMSSEGLDTVEAYARLGLQQDVREYGVVASILRALKVTSVSLLTNNPKKAEGVSTAGVRVNRVVPILAAALPERVEDLKVKRDKLGHLLPTSM